jgi:hypothetical protein
MTDVGMRDWLSKALWPLSSWVLAIGAVLALTGLAAPSSSAGSQFERFDRSGIEFEYPSRWFVTVRPLSNGVNPRYRFAVSTVRVRRTGADSGPCLPGIAQQLPDDAVLVYLREALGADRARSLRRMPPRPRGFRLPTRTDRSLCGFGPGGRWVPFKDAGRAFYLGVYVGSGAPASSVRLLGRMLDGMEIRPT